MDFRGCEKDVDNWLFRVAHTFPGSVDIAHRCTSKASNSDTMHSLRDFFDGYKIAWGGGGKTCLDDVHVESHKLLGNLKLLIGSHRCSW